MKSQPPIPTPPALRWREFRIRVLPRLVFAAGALVCAWIWSQHVAAPSFVGEAESVRAVVACLKAGTVTHLNVERFATVRANEVIGEVLVASPKYLESTLGVIKAEAQILRMQLDPVASQQRAVVDYERLRLDVLDQKVSLATAQAQLRYAESECNRLTALESGSQPVVSKDLVEKALRDRDGLRAEVENRARLVEDLSARVASIRINRPATDKSELSDSWRAALDLQEQRLQQALAEFGPLPLTAPIDGMVSTVYRRSGENVAAGEPILTIAATRSASINAHALPPFLEPPKVGMKVEVRSRSGRREAGIGEITRVAGYLDLATTAISGPAGFRGGAFAEQQHLLQGTANNGGVAPTPGLPLSVSIPPGMQLLPGELVDLRLLAADDNSARRPAAN
jgi:multidrug resistance efflux pump